MFMRVNAKCAQPSVSIHAKSVPRLVRRNHEVAKVEARSAKVDLQELRPASHQVRPPLAGLPISTEPNWERSYFRTARAVCRLPSSAQVTKSSSSSARCALQSGVSNA
jgi:hypothetical protein